METVLPLGEVKQVSSKSVDAASGRHFRRDAAGSPPKR